jgi:hypothetical protein
MPRRSPVLVLAAALGATASLALVPLAAAQMSVIVPSQPGPGIAPDPTIGRPAIPVRPIYPPSWPRPWPPRWGYPRPIPPYQSPDDPWQHDGDVHIQPWPYPGWPVRQIVTYGTGISVGGRYDDGALRLAFRVGAPVIYRGTPWGICNQGNIYYWSANRWNSYNPPWYRQAVFGTYRGSTQYIDPALTNPTLPAPPTNWTGQSPTGQIPGGQQPNAQPPEPPTAPEIAVLALRARQPEIAVRTLRYHLRTESGDARALRLLAVALLETRDFDDAASVMRLAYRTDPGLAAFALDFNELGYSQREARALLVRTVTYANRVNSASGLLSVAVLMQGEGREQPALNVLARAARAGLEPEVLDRLRDELGN